MEDKKKDEFEDLFKEKFENFEPEVSSDVWKHIQAGLKGVGIGVIGKMILNKIGTNAVIAIVSSAAAVVVTVVVMNMGSSEKGQTSNDSKIEKAPMIIEQPVKKVEPSVAVSSQEKSVKEEDNNQYTERKSADKQDKEHTQSVINAFEEESIASISASTVSGTIPLIVNFSNRGTGKISKWTFADGKEENTTTNPVHVFKKPGIYLVTLTATNSAGKNVMDSTIIEVKENPYASKVSDFSPNGDGNKDVFILNLVLPNNNVANMNFIVFDEKGSMVYSSKGVDAKWDGKDNKGHDVKEGLYFYVLKSESIDGKKYENKGEINLLR